MKKLAAILFRALLLVSTAGLAVPAGGQNNIDATADAPAYFDAQADTAAPETGTPLTSGLTVYFPFEGDGNAAVGNFSGTEKRMYATFTLDGRNSKGLLLSGKNPIFFGKPDELSFGSDRNFTLAFWFRTRETQRENAPIFGNRPLGGDSARGILFTAGAAEGEEESANQNLSVRLNGTDLPPMPFRADGRWHFAALTVDRGGDAVLYLGMPDGRLALTARRPGELGDLDHLDWYVGQDGTGTAPDPFAGDFDELMVWNRALADRDVDKLFRKGLEGKTVLK